MPANFNIPRDKKVGGFARRDENPLITPTKSVAYVTTQTPKTFDRLHMDATQQVMTKHVFDGQGVQKMPIVQPRQQPLENPLINTMTPDTPYNPGTMPDEFGISKKVSQKAATPPPYKGIPSIYNQTGKKS